MRPVCVPCQRFFRCIKTGFYFTEGMPKVSNAAPGTSEPEKWQPYKLWSGDKFECEGCGAVILSGFGQLPIRIQHQPDFVGVAQSLGADKFQVNDC